MRIMMTVVSIFYEKKFMFLLVFLVFRNIDRGYFDRVGGYG